MSKQHNKLPERKQPSPAELIAACEADIVRVERLRDQHIDRGVELAERRRVASYAAHVQHDPESRKQLDAVNAEIGTHASELQSFDDALVEARAKLNNAQALLARNARRRSRNCSSDRRNIVISVRSSIARPTIFGVA